MNTSIKHILPEIRREKLKKMLDMGLFIRSIEAHSGLSALICNGVEISHDSIKSHFDAIWISSLSSSAVRGLPDMELYALERRIDLIDEILHVTTKPLIVDVDTGGEAIAFEFLCSRLEDKGVSAIVIEDKKHPKRNSLSSESHHHLEDPFVFSRKLARGRKTLISKEFMIFARIESLIAGEDVSSALYRAKIYLEHGAHGIMIHSKDTSPQKIYDFLYRFRQAGFTAPVICIPTTYNKVTSSDLKEHGANIVIYANQLIRSSHYAMLQTCQSILEHDRAYDIENSLTPVSDIFELTGYNDAIKRD